MSDSVSRWQSLSPIEWRFEWLFVFLMLIGGLTLGDNARARAHSREWTLQNEGETATAHILDIRRWTRVRVRQGIRIPGTESYEYAIDIEWKDYHKARRTISNWSFSEWEAKRLGLDISLGEGARTLKIRYRLPADIGDADTERQKAESIAGKTSLPWCTPATLCRSVIVDNPSQRDPGETIFGSGDVDPGAWTVGAGVVGLLLSLVARFYRFR